MQRMTQLFTKTRKTAPADEVAMNAQLLIRAGYVHKEMAGVYSYLPLGYRVLQNIKKIVNVEMEKLGSSEIIMSTLQHKENWTVTDRWSDANVDVWFKSKLKNDTEIGFGWSHEEPITNLMKSHIESYKDLPVYVHQFQNKLRNETRAKSGIMRCREFVMKDMYSYSLNEDEHMKFYNATTEAYMNVYRALGLGQITYVTSASGGVFTDKFSHEFQTVCDAGEDIIYVHKTAGYAINEEVYNPETLAKMNAAEGDFEKKKAAEVGNIFTFGTDKCEQMGLVFKDNAGVSQPVFLGSYGIGVTRLMGVLVEVFADERGLVWPANVAPYTLHVVGLSDDAKVGETIAAIESAGISVLYDDRDASAGAKFADADLLGMPYRITLGKKFVENGEIELKIRATGEEKLVSLEQLIAAVRT
jgi:prolyl-tRNA synthetase